MISRMVNQKMIVETRDENIEIEPIPSVLHVSYEVPFVYTKHDKKTKDPAGFGNFVELRK
jgi:hypothetical protein